MVDEVAASRGDRLDRGGCNSATLPSPPNCTSICPPGRSAANRRREEALVVEDPVEGGVGEDRVDRLVELELGEVGDDQLDAARRSPRSSRACSIIDGDASTPITRPSGSAVEHVPGHPAAAAARVEDGFVSGEVEAVEHLEAPRAPACRRCGDRSPRPSRSCATARRSRVDRPQARGLGDALERDGLGGDPPATIPGAGSRATRRTAPRICASSRVDDLVGRPRLALHVLRPLVVADRRPRPRWRARRARPGCRGRRAPRRPRASSGRSPPRRSGA